MVVIRAIVFGLIFVSCGFSSSFHLGQRPKLIPYYSTTTALQMAFDEKAREEAVAKYIAKANEETMQALKKLEQEKDDEVRALQQKLADLLRSKSNLTPPSIDASSGKIVDSTLRQQEIELQALKLKVEELKQYVATSTNAISNIRDDYCSSDEVLRLRLAALQNSILNANDFVPANGFSTATRMETADELESLRLRLARLEDQLVERLRHGQQQQQKQQQYPPSPINTLGQEFSIVENQSLEIQTLRARIDNLVQKVVGRGS